MSLLIEAPMSSPCRYKRRSTVEVRIGDTPLGGDNPIRLQSMTTLSTMDTEGCVAQVERIVAAGADYVRLTAQGKREAKNLENIRSGLWARECTTPLVADIHFSPTAADEALEHVEKVRINPGNYVDTKLTTPIEWTSELFDELHDKVEERFGSFVERAKELGRAIRIGVNHGSLSERMLIRYGDTPEGMVESCLEYLDICRAHDFGDIVISMKSSNTTVMTSAVRLLVKRLADSAYPAYPIHLGVTEAGEGEDGRIKSSVGIGSLLMDGIGDTIRVSLSEEPEFEIPVAMSLRDYVVTRPSLPKGYDRLGPTWEEYRQLCEGGRRATKPVGKLIGGEGTTPLVLARSESEGRWTEMETRPDYLLSSEGQWYRPGGTRVLGMDTTTLHLSSIEAWLAGDRKGAEGVLCLQTEGENPVAEWRLMLTMLRRAGVDAPIILAHSYLTQDLDLFRIQAAADLGTLLLDGWGNALCISAPSLPVEEVIKTELGILQATRLRMSKTEFISCPSCGRTLYNLQTTIAEIKAAVSHLKGLKVGIMGCIVNGPGEMADADYGYVGSSPGKIDLYKGQECVSRGVRQEDAVAELIELIKSHGDWQEPK